MHACRSSATTPRPSNHVPCRSPVDGAMEAHHQASQSHASPNNSLNGTSPPPPACPLHTCTPGQGCLVYMCRPSACACAHPFSVRCESSVMRPMLWKPSPCLTKWITCRRVQAGAGSPLATLVQSGPACTANGRAAAGAPTGAGLRAQVCTARWVTTDAPKGTQAACIYGGPASALFSTAPYHE